MIRKKVTLLLLNAALISTLSACSSTLERLSRVGKDPKFANIDLPTSEEDEDQQERNKAIHEKQKAHQRKTNSLWQPGSTTFFRDSRAWKVGDIIRIRVQIQDNATLNNTTQQNRSGSDSMGLTALFGKQNAVAHVLNHNANPANLLGSNTTRNHSGGGNISRKEVIRTDVAALVTRVLPNGNLVVQGHQEVKVNSELREIKVAGIIRPKDIDRDNSVNTNQIAEARISYGGRGIVSDVQRPRYGSEIIDILSPF